MDKAAITQERSNANGNNQAVSYSIQANDKHMKRFPDLAVIKLEENKPCAWCQTLFPASCLDRVGQVGNQEINELLCPGCLYSFKHGAPQYGNLP